MMSIKYGLQKIFGWILDTPVFHKDKTIGYSLLKSEKSQCVFGIHTKVYPPFFLNNVILGDYSYMAKNASVCNCEVGKFCSIGPNFCCGLGIHPTNGISTSPVFYSASKRNGITICKETKIEEFLHTTIGNDVFIGANVTILDGVHIGDGAVIGAGAVVTKDIPEYAIAVGVPAKVMRYRFDSSTIKGLLEKKWWDGDEQEIRKVEELFWEVNKFIQ